MKHQKHFFRAALLATALAATPLVRAQSAPAENPLATPAKSAPLPADSGMTTLALATGIGLIMIAATLAVTVFPRRRRA